ncbi:hypothetical protein SLEP1_g50630 [Rubroshorea leprosula]|uniref:Protein DETOXIFICATION n=1 Tax=Rubroshorea leprosula TaxID=152421 RepID=A0AAV5M0N4_9ROSI|nr:hypothetical protein SLEP1_g50630 [Rubroshorea leprosula]
MERGDREERKFSLHSPLIQVSRENSDAALNVNEGGRINERGTSISSNKKIFEEVKKQLWLAGPLISVSLLQNFIQIVSVMFVGHLGELPLSGASIGTSFASFTGLSLLTGMASALDTLCGQSYGAKHYQMLGIHMQRAIFVLVIVSIPLAIILANTRSILVFLGQDYDIAKEAGQYASAMVPSLFAYSFLQCLVRFLQAQYIVFPMMLCSGITILFHIPVCWALVFKSGLGSRGAAFANAISHWSNVLLLACYVRFSPSCAKTWTGFSNEALHNVLTFIRLAIPSAVMLCLVSWSFEMVILAAGLLPNPELETSVLSISLSTAGIVWMIPLGLSGAASVRVSNELGAGHPDTARLAACVVLVITITQGLLVGSVLILIRKIWGYAYSNEMEVVRYLAAVMPILAACNFLDGLQCVLSGIVRGSGLQKIAAYINLGSFYFVGIPSAILLAFILHIGGRGLWLGIISALIVQVSSLLIILIRANWEQEAKKALERVYNSTVPVDMV